jgi:hypothetical protein
MTIMQEPSSLDINQQGLERAVDFLQEAFPWDRRYAYKRAVDFLHAAGLEVEGWTPDGHNRLIRQIASRKTNVDNRISPDALMAMMEAMAEMDLHAHAPRKRRQLALGLLRAVEAATQS